MQSIIYVTNDGQIIRIVFAVSVEERLLAMPGQLDSPLRICSANVNLRAPV